MVSPVNRLLVALALLLVACETTAVSTTTTSTTVVEATTTTAGAQLVDGGLVPTDPPTLVPLQNAEPVVVGLAHRGVVSPSGRWAAIVTAVGSGPVGAKLSIVDLTSLEVMAAADVDPSSVVVNDDGRAFFFVDSALTTLGIDGVLAAVDAPDSPFFLQPTLADLGEGRVGYLSASESERSNVDVVVAADSGVVSLFGVARAAGPGVADDRLPHRANVVPAVAWTSETAYVVSAETNAMTVVDLATGAQADTEFIGSDEPFENPVQRSAWAAPTGLLFIATSALEVVDRETDWTATETPQQLVVVDLDDGSSATQDVTLSTLYPSRDGSTLTGIGLTAAWNSAGENTTSQGPVFLLDTETGEPIVGFEGNSGDIVEVQYSPDVGEIYVMSMSELGTNIDVVDTATRSLAGNVAFTSISLIGHAALMAFHSSPGN